MKTPVKLVVVLIILAAAAAGGWWYYQRTNTTQGPAFRTAQVQRGEIIATISATGTVEPEEVVDVGAQVAGLILFFGKDKNGKPVDYGSQVQIDTILAQIDDTLYSADVAAATAQLQSNQAGVVRAQADLEQLQARYNQAKRDWERAQKIGPSDALAEVTYDGYKAAFDISKANVDVGQATLLQARAAVAQAEASLVRARRNLSYCVIKSPVNGVIIDRRVNIGQTVVASLNAPSLFLIAKDLKRMQVWVSVNEADIGSIHPGQPVTFTVDAYPSTTFKGEVGKIRLNASMTQNVVTYTVEVLTDNSSGKLLPYLTANVKFEVDHREDVLLVPNAALRWTPATSSIAPNNDVETASTRPATRKSSTRSSDSITHGTLWIRDGQFVKAVQVRTGPTDGTNTEIRTDKLPEGSQVVIGESKTGQAKPAGGGEVNPFAPQIPRGGGRFR